MKNVQLNFRVSLLMFMTSIPVFLTSNIIASHGPVLDDYVFAENIRTVRMHVKGWELSYPVIELNSREELIFSFDDLDGNVKNYNYKIIHCNSDWTPSSLYPSDFMEGFYENRIDNYRFSFNTSLPYIHYSLALPNPDISFKLSGNYIIKVFEGYDGTEPLITRRFMISDHAVTIDARVHRPGMTVHQGTGQQLTINISHPDIVIRDPHSELSVTVMQNGRHDKAKTGLNPTYMRANETVYDDDINLLFQGGNEFRNFDIKNLRYYTESIRSIEYEGGMYHADLKPSSPRQYSRYFSQHDINGRFLVRNEQGRDPSIDADYVYVYFTLEWGEPFDNGNVYIMGELGDWNYYRRNTMSYNYDLKVYEGAMLLKQGYYNYQYVYLEDDASVSDATFFEGNFFETENDYLIMVYHRPPGSRFDRLVGTKQINSAR